MSLETKFERPLNVSQFHKSNLLELSLVVLVSLILIMRIHRTFANQNNDCHTLLFLSRKIYHFKYLMVTLSKQVKLRKIPIIPLLF